MTSAILQSEIQVLSTLMHQPHVVFTAFALSSQVNISCLAPEVQRAPAAIAILSA